MKIKTKISTHRQLSIISCQLILASLFILSSCGNKNGDYDASGTFEATEIIVSSEGNGKILAFNVEEGQVLQANEKVGFIDSLQLFLRKKQLETNIKAVKSRRPETQKQRIERLLKANAANQKQLDDINAQIAYLEKQLEAQKSNLNITSNSINEDAATLQVQIEQLNDQLKKCQIINPIKGTVLVKYAEKDEVTAQGKALYKIADTDNMILRAYITADQLTKVKLGQTVEVYADYGADDNKKYSGTISWISDKAEFTPKTIQTRDERANLVYAVKIAVKNDGMLKIGMYGEVKLTPLTPEGE